MLLLLLLLLLLLSLLLPQKHLLHLSLSRGGVLGCEPGADAASQAASKATSIEAEQLVGPAQVNAATGC